MSQTAVHDQPEDRKYRRRQAMAGEKSLLAVIVIWLERIVDRAAKAGVARVQGGRFLIEKSVRKVQQQAVSIAMLKLRLECVAAPMTEVSKPKQEISQSRKGLAGQIGRRVVTISIINRVTRSNSISCGCAERDIAGRYLIQIHSPD